VRIRGTRDHRQDRGARRTRGPAGTREHVVDRREQRGAVGEPARRVLVHRALHQRTHVRRDVRRQRLGELADLLDRDLHGVLALERPPSGQALVGDRTEGVDVAGRGRPVALRLLR
jgi:hypothetical protein